MAPDTNSSQQAGSGKNHSGLEDERYIMWKKSAPAEYKKKLLEDFLHKTIEYAEHHIGTRIPELPKTAEIPQELEHKINRLAKWISYIEFQRHTLGELEKGQLEDFYS